MQNDKYKELYLYPTEQGECLNRLRLDSSPPWSFNSFFCKKFEISKKFSYKSRIGLYKVVLDMQNDKYKEVL